MGTSTGDGHGDYPVAAAKVVGVVVKGKDVPLADIGLIVDKNRIQE